MRTSWHVSQARGKLDVRKRMGLALLTGLAVALVAVAWSFASPPGSSADDDWHLASIWCAGEGSPSCVRLPDGRAVIPENVVRAGCFIRQPERDATCVRLLTDRPVLTDRVNPASGAYPPAFYAAMHVFVGDDPARSVLLMRLGNSLLAAIMIAGTVALASTRVRIALMVALLIALVPVGAFFLPSTNPSSWAITGVVTVVGSLLSLAELTRQQVGARRDRLQRAGLWSLALLGGLLAMAARVESIVPITVAAAAAALLARWRGGARTISVVLVGAAASVAALVFALRFRLGTYLETYRLTFPPGTPASDMPNPAAKMLAELPALLSGVLGAQAPSWIQREAPTDFGLPGYSYIGMLWGIGEVDTRMPSLVGVIGLLCLGGAIFTGLSSVRWRKLTALMLGLVAIVTQAFVIRSFVGFGVWGYRPGDVDWALQPRYFWPLVFVIITVSLLRLHGGSRLSAPQIVAFATLGTVAATVALMATMNRYIHGQGAAWMNVTVGDGWWWPRAPDPILVLFIGSAGMVFLSVACVLSAEHKRASREEASALMPVSEVIQGPTEAIDKTHT